MDKDDPNVKKVTDDIANIIKTRNDDRDKKNQIWITTKQLLTNKRQAEFPQRKEGSKPRSDKTEDGGLKEKELVLKKTRTRENEKQAKKYHKTTTRLDYKNTG